MSSNPQTNNMMTGYYMQDMSNPQQQIRTMSHFLFVADLPDECCAEDLDGFFKGYGYQFSNVVHNIDRTYAFVSFENREKAEKARNELNGVKITAKYASEKNKIPKPVRICKYETKSLLGGIDPKCNLLVKNISKDVSAHLLFNTFKKFGDIRSSKLKINSAGESLGFGFISFYKVQDAINAHDELNGKLFEGKELKINFLEKGRPHVNIRNNIYVKEIPKENFDDQDLKKLFEKFGEIKSAVVLKDEEKKSKGFGFVCFLKPQDAENALKEMNNKKVFDLPNNLYVSFAMKKAERKEELIKKKAKMYKENQKMTVYAAIKDEDKITDENIFKDCITGSLKNIMGEDFEPKYIKILYNTKNAFITMNSQSEAKEFLKKIQESAEDENQYVKYSIYKPKRERVDTHQKYVSYNNFSETGSLISGQNSKSGRSQKYQNYNDFDSMSNSQSNMASYNSMPNKPKYNNYNNFPQNNMLPQKQKYNNYNNFAQNNMLPQNIALNNKKYVDYNNFGGQNNNLLPQNIPQNSNMNYMNENISGIPGMQYNIQKQKQIYNNFNNESNGIPPRFVEIFNREDPSRMKGQEQIGDFIYELAESIYGEEAGKIAGMILELGYGKLSELIINIKDLYHHIKQGHLLIQKTK